MHVAIKISRLSFLGQTKIAELLIEKGADVDVEGQDGVTAITVAANKGRRHSPNSAL